jgi:hypothetical protein
MSDSKKISERNVASTAISKSFKGILRVSNIKELGTSPDVFLNSEYYGEYTPTVSSPTWEPVGTQSIESALSGDNDRYLYGDAYTTLRLPVTDSMGNYMNFSLGVEGSLIGNDHTSGIWNFQGPTIYTLTSDNTKIGLSEIKLEAEKEYVGGKLNIENRADEIAQIVVNSYYRHSQENHNGTLKPCLAPTEITTKTIYQGSEEANLYDAFIYNQESYVSNKTYETNTDLDGNITTDVVPATEKQCIVKIANLKDYVLDKVNAYIKYNTTEIPTGTIINQFCSIDKWYCRVNGAFEDSEEWQGFRPALGNPIPGTESKDVPSTFGYDNTEQSVFSNGTRLKFEASSFEFNSVEMPPEFKRGYVLADGSSYEIRLVPPYAVDVESVTNSKKTLDLFFKLFFTIGYYYTPSVPAFPHVYREPDDPVGVMWDNNLTSKPTEGRYYYDYNKPALQNYTYEKYILKNVDKETLYGISLASILAFKKFSEAYNDKYVFNTQIADAAGKWDIEKSIQWLSNQFIDEEFIFNTVFSNESIQYAKDNKIDDVRNIMYKYSDADKQYNVNLPLGREVRKFSDYIEYYTLSNVNNSIVLQKIPCQIHKTAEIYDIARLFANKLIEGWGNYKVVFNVPKAWTDEDNAINDFNSITGNGATGSVGLFIGSTGLSAADKIILPTKNVINADNTTYNILDSYEYQQSHCTFTIGYQPHSHALAKGVLNLSEGRHTASPTHPAELSPLTIGNTPAKNTIANLNELEDKVLAADCTWGNYMLKSSNLGAQNWKDKPGAWNYFLQERGYGQKVWLDTIYNGINATMGRELAVHNSDGSTNHDMLWYGRTSGPIWDPNVVQSSGSSKYTINTNPGYFRPQSIKLLPLIKL